ncbi:hypothetical protein RJ035_005082 [Blastomyces gilchristii]
MAPITVSNQQCVRVNPCHLVGPDSDAEERKIITTAPCPRTIGISLREYLVGIGSRQGSSPKPVEALPSPASTACYTHYGDAPLSAEQFEIMWQFGRFAKTGKVVGLGHRIRLRRRVLPSMGLVVPMPTGWTETHFALFFEEYCAFKTAASATIDGFNNVSTSKWGDVKPLRELNEDELSRYFIDTNQRSPGSPNWLSKLDLTLDNLIEVKEKTRREKAKVRWKAPARTTQTGSTMFLPTGCRHHRKTPG